MPQKAARHRNAMGKITTLAGKGECGTLDSGEGRAKPSDSLRVQRDCDPLSLARAVGNWGQKLQHQVLCSRATEAGLQLLLACVAQALLCFLTRLQFAQQRIQQNRTWKGTSVAMATLDRLQGIGLAAGDVTTCSCWTTRIKKVPVCISLSPQMSGWSIHVAVMLLRRCFQIQKVCFVANSTWAERFPMEASHGSSAQRLAWLALELSRCDKPRKLIGSWMGLCWTLGREPDGCLYRPFPTWCPPDGIRAPRILNQKGRKGWIG